ncbi:MAG: hypothetical protein WAT09_14505 [Paracoccaceae bacterium]
MNLAGFRRATVAVALTAQPLWADAPLQPWSQAFTQTFGIECQPGTPALPAWATLQRLGMAPEWALICGDKRVVSVTLAADPAQSLSQLQRPLLAAFLAEKGTSLYLLDQSRGSMVSLTPLPPAGMAMALVPAPELPQVMFAGQPDPAWLPYAHRGGGFDAGASYADQQLHLRVGPDMGTATVGLTSTAPVVWLPDPGSGILRRLIFAVALDQADGAQFALLPPEQAGAEDWAAHDLMIRVEHEGDAPPFVALYIDESRKGLMPLERLRDRSSLTLDLNADGFAVLRDGAGLWLAEATLPVQMGTGGWHLQTSVRPVAHHGTAAMDLATITSQPLRAPDGSPPMALPAPFAPPGTVLQTTLFDGTRFGPWMQPYSVPNLPFAQCSTLADGVLAISVDENRVFAEAGLYSTEPLIWLDRFTDSAEIRLRIEIDPALSSGLRVALAQDLVRDGGSPGAGSYAITLVRTAEGGLRLGRILNSAADPSPLVYPDRPDLPRVLELVLRPGMIDVFADGQPLETGLSWPGLKDGRALRLVVNSHAAIENTPATLGLRRIDLTRRIGPALSGAGQAPAGLEPFARRVLMAPGQLSGWIVVTPSSPEMAEEVRLDAQGLKVQAAPRFESAAAGAITMDPVVILDDRLDLAGQRIALRFDPATTTGFHVQLADYADSDLNKEQYMLVSLIKQDEGRDAGNWQLQLYGGFYQTWTRPLSAAEMALWDGQVLIDITTNTVRATLPGTTALEAPGFHGMHKGVAYHLSVLSFATHRYGPAALHLTEASIGTLAPPLLDQGTRLLLEPDDDFDADAYIDWLASQMTKDGP